MTPADPVTPAVQFAAIIAEMAESPNLIGQTVAAVLVGDLVDGVPVTSASIGALMAAHAADLEAQFGEDGSGPKDPEATEGHAADLTEPGGDPG